jgi:hypothetical protein
MEAFPQMTTPYTARSNITELHDMIDKHVPIREAALQEHYMKADETRALLKALGCWPTRPGRAVEPRGKKPKVGKLASEIGRDAYHWAQANGATYTEAAERFKVDANVIHSYRQYRKLPKLKR